MHKLIEEIVERAKANRQRIVLPEGTEERTLKAANQILTDGVADLILIGDPAEIEVCAKEWGLGNIHKATIINPENNAVAGVKNGTKNNKITNIVSRVFCDNFSILLHIINKNAKIQKKTEKIRRK